MLAFTPNTWHGLYFTGVDKPIFFSAPSAGSFSARHKFIFVFTDRGKTIEAEVGRGSLVLFDCEHTEVDIVVFEELIKLMLGVDITWHMKPGIVPGICPINLHHPHGNLNKEAPTYIVRMEDLTK